MIAHVWFIVVAFAGHPGEEPLSLGRFPTRAACMAAAPARVSGFQAIGDHGRYLCMYSGQPDAGLASDPIAAF